MFWYNLLNVIRTLKYGKLIKIFKLKRFYIFIFGKNNTFYSFVNIHFITKSNNKKELVKSTIDFLYKRGYKTNLKFDGILNSKSEIPKYIKYTAKDILSKAFNVKKEEIKNVKYKNKIFSCIINNWCGEIPNFIKSKFVYYKIQFEDLEFDMFCRYDGP